MSLLYHILEKLARREPVATETAIKDTLSEVRDAVYARTVTRANMVTERAERQFLEIDTDVALQRRRRTA